MMAEHPQIVIPPLQGVRVDVLAASVAGHGYAMTQQDFGMSRDRPAWSGRVHCGKSGNKEMERSRPYECE